jgi:hypothetical protein
VLPRDENASGTVLLDTSAGPHLYADGVFTPLPGLTGYRNFDASAMNDRGDVVGTAMRSADSHSVAILWPANGTPVVIDSPDYHWTGGSDIDEDGTILLGGAYQAVLWRAGRVIPLPNPSPPVLPRALRGGKAVGIDLDAVEAPRAVLWRSPQDVRYPQNGGAAEDINSSGLIVGHLNTSLSPLAVWRGTRLLAELPLPPDAAGVTSPRISDDGTVYGNAGVAGPVFWTCQ